METPCLKKQTTTTTEKTHTHTQLVQCKLVQPLSKSVWRLHNKLEMDMALWAHSQRTSHPAAEIQFTYTHCCSSHSTQGAETAEKSIDDEQ